MLETQTNKRVLLIFGVNCHSVQERQSAELDATLNSAFLIALYQVTIQTKHLVYLTMDTEALRYC